MTNFEKIKNMSLEELAAKCCGNIRCAGCPIWDFCTYTMHNDDSVQLLDCLNAQKDSPVLNQDNKYESMEP